MDLRLCNFIRNSLDDGKTIYCASQVQLDYKKEYGADSTREQICKILKQDFSMSFKKNYKVAPGANSDASVIIRQRSAMMFLQMAKTRSRWISIDESFIGMANYGRKKWQKKGNSTQESLKPVIPRVTLIGAIDNFGEAYVSIL